MARTHPETACYTQPILNPALAHNTAFKNNVTQNGIWTDGLSTSWFGRTASKSDTIRHVVSLLGYFRWNLETALFFPSEQRLEHSGQLHLTETLSHFKIISGPESEENDMA